VNNPSSTRWIGLWALGFLCVAIASQPTARADSSKACAEAYEKAQEERKAGHITAAIEQLTRCAAQECPSFVRKDCIQWMTDAESTQPTVVFAVHRDGVEVTEVQVLMDGRVLARAIDGKAVALDPGPHLFSFRAPDGTFSERRFIIREGERNRLIEIELVAKAPARVPSPQVEVPAQNVEPPRDDPKSVPPGRSWLPYGLAGVGALGISGFAAFGIWGRSQKNHLESTCSPFCQSSQVDEVRTKYIMADTCLAVGLVSLGFAVYYFLRERGESSNLSGAPAAATILPTATYRSGVVDVAIRF
jgi:hypothetical protein